jgi:uncharacterized protein involved in type VI secretion and phage assembly
MVLPLHLISSQPSFPGLYRGAVADVDDPTHRGRIKVTVPAVFDQTTPDAAVWAMACFPWGHVFVPEVGDKVWVAFEDGDPTTPVWLGQWHPSDGVPASAAVSPPVKRLISSKSGHEILLDDSTGAEKIVIHSKTAAQKIVLDETSGAEKIVISDKGGCSIELAAGGITIKAPGKAITLIGASVDVQAG